MKYITELLYILKAMSPYLLLGFFVAGVLQVYVPRAAFARYLSKRGFRADMLSALLGVPLPLCSCGVIPTAMSLKREGATSGATISFLIATPQTGVDSILATYGVLGLPFAIIRPIVALVVGVMGGMVVDRFTPNEGNTTPKGLEPNDNCSITKRVGLMDIFRYGFINMLQDLGGWLTIGLIVAAAITIFVPDGVFDALGQNYILNIVVVLLLSIPMYICSTGSIPIALSLLMKGISPGAALIFLMAGPATNVATLAVVRKVLGVRTTILYLISIIAGAIGFAAIIDFALPAEWFAVNIPSAQESAHCMNNLNVWQTICSAIFVLLLINANILKFKNRGVNNSQTTKESVMTTQSVKVSGMQCNHCKSSVEKAVANLSGVTAVRVDLSSGTVEVDGDVSKDIICTTIEQLGFDIVK